MILTLIVLTTLQTKVSDFEDLDPYPEPSLNLPLIGKPHNMKLLVYLDIANLCVCWGRRDEGGGGVAVKTKNFCFQIFPLSILPYSFSLSDRIFPPYIFSFSISFSAENIHLFVRTTSLSKSVLLLSSFSPAPSPPSPWSSSGLTPPSSMVPLLLPYPSLPHSVIYMSQVLLQLKIVT